MLACRPSRFMHCLYVHALLMRCSAAYHKPNRLVLNCLHFLLSHLASYIRTTVSCYLNTEAVTNDAASWLHCSSSHERGDHCVSSSAATTVILKYVVTAMHNGFCSSICNRAVHIVFDERLPACAILYIAVLRTAQAGTSHRTLCVSALGSNCYNIHAHYKICIHARHSAQTTTDYTS
jgi:hypothetical protein